MEQKSIDCSSNKHIYKKWDNDQYICELEKIHNGNIISLEVFNGMNKKILHKCIRHDYCFYIKPANIVYRKQGCRYCGYEKVAIAERDSLESVRQKIFNKCGNEFELLDDNYINNSTKMKFLHNLDDGSHHTFYATVNHILNGQGCGVCHGQQICIGYNDIATTNPEIASLFANQAETKMYTQWSGRKVNFKCPNCGHIIKKTISMVSRDGGISCPICGDGYSYPNKFIYNCLMQISNQLDYIEREYQPEWCVFEYNNSKKSGRYDIYFSINNKFYICEMDGGLGHGNRTLGASKEESLFIDSEKDRLAKEHGITIIRIDCDYKTGDRFEFIKNNIINSQLSDILDLSKIDFNKANIEAQSSLMIRACNLWNEGYNAGQIASKINVVQSTVTHYLTKGFKYNICKNYSKVESTYRSHGRMIICLNNKKIFRSIVDGAKFYGITESVISKCCRRKSIYGGTYNNEKLVWMYLDEFENYSDDEINQYLMNKDNNVGTKVVCLNTNVVFNTIKSAYEWCGSKSPAGIIHCCKGKYLTSGKHPTTQEPLKWMYYDDYIKKYDESALLLFDKKSA